MQIQAGRVPALCTILPIRSPAHVRSVEPNGLPIEYQYPANSPVRMRPATSLVEDELNGDANVWNPLVGLSDLIGSWAHF
jgi:hypothetical protein